MENKRIDKLDLLAETKFLSLYNATYSNKSDKIRNWTIASRKRYDVLKGQLLNDKNDNVDAVVIVALHQKEEKLVLVRQYRVPINGYIYELPAGLIDDGEDPAISIKRELKEETGLELIKVVNGIGRDKVYLSPGMTDESVNLIYCLCDGELSKENLEDDEDIEPLLISKDDAKKILESDEKLDIKCLMVLQSFINLDINKLLQK